MIPPLEQARLEPSSTTASERSLVLFAFSFTSFAALLPFKFVGDTHADEIRERAPGIRPERAPRQHRNTPRR